MFYTTTIKSVGSTGVIDAQGRRLNCIGYLPVKEGDTVYTDGRFIFGNAPPKGAPAIFNDEPSGIPVLGDEDSSGDELRGYFTINGKYKRYRIAGDNWITNGKKKYAHDGKDIIDAEIALDEDGNEDGVYTVEKKIQDIGQPPDNDTFDELYTALSGFFSGSIFKDSDICSDDEILSRNLILIVKSDNRQVQEIDIYSQFLKGYEEAALNATMVVNGGAVVINDYLPKEWESQLLERHSGLRAQLINFKISPDGKWTLLISFQVVVRWKFYYPRENRQWYAFFTVFKLAEFPTDNIADGKFHSEFITYRIPTNLDNWSIVGKEWRARRYTFPIQDGFYAEIKFTEPTNDIWWNSWTLDKIYNANGEQLADFSNIVNSFDAHKWNMSLATLKDGAYLFGIHDDQSRDIDGKLYKISSDGQVEQVGNRLKNFRLRELKKISKAKK